VLTQPAQPGEPIAECFSPVALPSERMIAAEAVPNAGGATRQQRIEVPLIDPQEVPARDPFDNGGVHGSTAYVDIVHIALY